MKCRCAVLGLAIGCVAGHLLCHDLDMVAFTAACGFIAGDLVDGLFSLADKATWPK
jgi:hypothetical protein